MTQDKKTINNTKREQPEDDRVEKIKKMEEANKYSQVFKGPNNRKMLTYSKLKKPILVTNELLVMRVKQAIEESLRSSGPSQYGAFGKFVKRASGKEPSGRGSHLLIQDHRFSELQQHLNKLEAEIKAISDQHEVEKKIYMDNERTLLTLIANMQSSRAMTEQRMDRIVPIRVYLQVNSPHLDSRITNAIRHILNITQLSLYRHYPPEISSFWKELFAKTKEAASQPEVQKRLAKIERALELETIDRKQATINKDEAEAVKTLLDAIKDTPTAAIQLGPMVVIKTTDSVHGTRVFAKTLSQEQLVILNGDPLLITQPLALFDFVFGRNNKTQSENVSQDRLARINLNESKSMIGHNNLEELPQRLLIKQ